MHRSSYLKAQLFLKHYGDGLPREDGTARVLEIGSRAYNAQETYRPLFPSAEYSYTGLDVLAGPNVDIVPENGYVWSEVPSESFDLCISGQTFEHNPLFWVTFAEIARVLSPGGLAFIVAPGAGKIHRFPYDCWRFYPDGWIGLCAMAGLELVESYFEADETAVSISGGKWRDSALIARKPGLEGTAREAFHAHLEALVAPYRSMSFTLEEPRFDVGPCFREYNEVAGRYSEPVGPFGVLRRRARRPHLETLHDGRNYRGG